MDRDNLERGYSRDWEYPRSGFLELKRMVCDADFIA